MGAIAKGEITLSPVNDAYTVLLTPASCTINADFNGDNPCLANVSGQISVKRGSVEVPFTATPFAYSGSDISVTVVGNHFKLDRISTRDLSGWIDFRIEVNDGFNYVTTCRFTFAVVRETTMLDWILDWENNKTKIGDSYIMTPKMFIGRKEDVAETIEVEDSDSYTEETRWIEGALTGVYIGPDLLSYGENSAGIYGYFQNHEIFHLNAEGGMIGGWDIANGGIQTADGKLHILSEGTIISQEDSTTHWALYADGSAIFANGNVTFQPNGNASFKGSITASTGSIGDWRIEEVGLYNGPVLIDATNRYIGIVSNANWNSSPTGRETMPNAILHRTWVQDTGGVAMFWESGSDYGLIAYSATGKVVQLGSTNTIAGWTIAPDAIYLGEKNNSQGGFTTDGVTIGTNGLRGKTWNIDTNGHASFANEKVVFNADGTASISGWLINTTRFSTDHAALVSSSMFSGLFITPADISDVGDTSLVSTVNNNGGIYIYSDSANSLMRSKDKDGNTCFFLSTTGYNTIGPWSFDNQSIYKGSTNLDANGFVGQNSILLSTQGLRGYKWNLLADGSGAIAGGNIKWTADGTVTFAENVTLNWANISGAFGLKLTQIDANGIYTGTIRADQITVGTIDATLIDAETIISNGEAWALNKNGSGYLANKNVEWDSEGNVNVKGSFSQDLHPAYKSDVIYLPTATSVDDHDRKVVRINKKLYLSTNYADQEYIEYMNRGVWDEEWPYTLRPIGWWQFILPTDPSYIGKEIKIYDGNFGPYSRMVDSFCDTLVTTDNNALGIVGIPPKFTTTDYHPTGYSWDAISVLGGYIELVGVPLGYWDNGTFRRATQWVCVQYNGINVSGYKDSHGYDLVRSFTTLSNSNA